MSQTKTKVFTAHVPIPLAQKIDQMAERLDPLARAAFWAREVETDATDPEAGVGLSGDPQEHLDGGTLLDLGRRGAGLRDVERRHRDRLLRATTQGHPAGHEQS